MELRLSLQVRADTGPWWRALVCGAVVKADQHFAKEQAAYVQQLIKGHAAFPEAPLTEFSDRLVLDGTKYDVGIQLEGPDTYRVTLGGTAVEVGF